MYPTIEAHLGRLMANALMTHGVPTTGRFYFVGKAALSLLQEVQGMYPASYPDGSRLFHSTVKDAVAACTASRGDVIFVLPGHTEDVTSNTDLNVNVAGVSVIGLGTGNLRPTFTLKTATSALITISAANCGLYDVIVDGTGIDAIASMVSITAAGVTVKGNKFTLASATAQATLGILTTAAATDLSIVGNVFKGTNNAGCTAAIELVGGDNILIEGNYIQGAFTAGVGGITNITTDVTNLTVKDNLINNLTALSTKAMTFTSGSTGFISGNKMQILSGTAPITGAAMSWVGGNYYAATIATAGTLI